MKNCLILITKKYPFETGEEFIENEIPIMAKNFSKIIIIASSVDNSSNMTRTVPVNTEVHAITAKEIKNCTLSMSLNFLPFSKLEKLSGQKEYYSIKHSFIKKMFLLYFSAKSEAVFKKCAEIVKGCGLEKYDETVFYSYWFYDTAYAAVKLRDICCSKKKYAVCRAHRYDLYHEQNKVGYIPLRRHILDGIDKVYPCSQDGCSYLKKLYPGYAFKIETAYLGTKDYGISGTSGTGVFNIISCCHISPVKRVDLLAQALYLLKDSGLKLKWTHFGGGSGFADLKQYAQDNLGFMDYEFPGEIKNSKLMEYYKNNHVDCFINTSSSEGLPVSIMEACSFGIPVIATDVGGTAEIVRNGENGFLIGNNFSTEELAAKIKLLCTMTDSGISKMRSNSRDIWLKNFSCNNNYSAFAKKICGESDNP